MKLNDPERWEKLKKEYYDYRKKYYINISVLAFDEEKSKDFPNFLDKWIQF